MRLFAVLLALIGSLELDVLFWNVTKRFESVCFIVSLLGDL